MELTPNLERLFRLVEELSVEAIEKEFCPPRKKIKPLSALLEDKIVRKAILSYVHRRLDELLHICIVQEYAISWEAERRSHLSDLILEPARQALQPELSFTKTEAGVTYRLLLKEGRQTWAISTREVTAITNNPAWLVVGFRIYQVAHINGFMIKPFRSKDVVQIPKNSVGAYFRQFIFKVAAKADIKAEGFEVSQYSRLEACAAGASSFSIYGGWGLSVQMVYKLAQFNWSDKKLKQLVCE